MGDTAKQFSLQNFRPEGFEYPIGLTPQFQSLSSNSATNTTGGTQTMDGSNAIHTFTVSGTFTPGFTGDVEYLVVAGGGGGGSRFGGGGAGGYRYASGFPITASSPYTVTVGGGGAGSTGSGSANGQNSVFSSITSLGGGGGGGDSPSPDLRWGKSGGSGGGSSGNGTSPVGSYVGGAAGTPGQGYRGGTGWDQSGANNGGGGGGAGAQGTDSIGAPALCDGGIGLETSISGSPVFYAGGGAGSRQSPTAFADGGLGGGGGGSSGVNGDSNRGGGGGSGGDINPGGNGGSGIVIVRYLAQQFANSTFYSIN